MEEGQAILKVDRDLRAVFLRNLTAIFSTHFKTEDEIRMFVRRVCVR